MAPSASYVHAVVSNCDVLVARDCGKVKMYNVCNHLVQHEVLHLYDIFSHICSRCTFSSRNNVNSEYTPSTYYRCGRGSCFIKYRELPSFERRHIESYHLYRNSFRVEVTGFQTLSKYLLGMISFATPYLLVPST